MKNNKVFLLCQEDEEKIYDINNGITLCLNCHNKTKWHELEYQDIFQKIINSKEIVI